MFEKAKEKLEANIKLSDDIKEPFVKTKCHLWQGKILTDGYGRTSVYGKNINVHILSCEIKEKKHRPKHLVTRHLCGVKICCNPEHLEFGTSTENALDNVKHGKSRAKLNEEIIKEIRETLGKDNLTKVQRAKKYNISETNLREIEKNRIWVDV